MNKPITSSTYVRCLNLGLIRKLSDFIDPQEGWKKLAVAIKKPSGDDRYNQFHIRRFEALLQTGKSPTCELLFDWGTTNCTVGDLVDLLIQNEFFAPASLLLPDAIPKTPKTVPSKEAVTVQQQQMPLNGNDRTFVLPVQNFEQNYMPPDSSSPENTSLEGSDTRFHSFSFYELKNVTNNFDERPISLGGNKMGEGGFGVVYKGHVNNKTVAVKKLAAMVDISTEELKQQFDQEIKVMAKCTTRIRRFYPLLRAHHNMCTPHLSPYIIDVNPNEIYQFLLNYTHCYKLPIKILDRVVTPISTNFLESFHKTIIENYVTQRCQHENLVELLGFSSDGDDLCLVYVYMPNGSLLDRLSCLDGTPPLSWHMRCKIAQGAANGISFLHENHHIHRDIKSANILLDEDFTAKVSDFGLARASEKFAQTVMTSRIVGTTAYMAPEALRGEITPKSDIYSFGVVLLEIITGLPAVDEHREPQLLLDIKEEIEDEEKTIEDYIDPKMNDTDPTSIETMYSVASQCLHEKKNKRPDIKKVQQLLQDLTAS